MLSHRSHRNFLLSLCDHRDHFEGSSGWIRRHSNRICLTLIHLFLIPVKNASVNPAHSTGPALFAGGAYIGQLWLFWLAPTLGAALAGAVGRWQHELDDNP